MSQPIAIVDLFAGAGGFSEGFFHVRDAHGNPAFETVFSIEKDHWAHCTFELRGLYHRLYRIGNLKPYWQYIKGDIDRKELFSRAGDLGKQTQNGTLLATMGQSESTDLEIEDKIGRSIPGDFILIGGPPCQAYSVIGRARRTNENRGQFESDPRHVLYREYLKILKRFRPVAFVMENVPGIITAKLNGRFVLDMIFDDLRAAGYDLYHLNDGPDDPHGYIINAAEYGVPQSRSRVFILGLRCDLNLKKRQLTRENSEIVSTGDVIDDLPPIRSMLSGEEDSPQLWADAIKNGFYNLQLGDIEPKFKETIYRNLENINPQYPVGLRIMESSGIAPLKMADWFNPNSNGWVLNHNSRKHMRMDLISCFFWAEYGKYYGKSPLMTDIPPCLVPEHKNLADLTKGSPFQDRFKVQLKIKPATTITSHITKDGRYYMHYDSRQCRTLSVREAARLQTFPDDYLFEGAVSWQYNQVGNAVPPFLSKQIAETLYSILRGN